MWALGFDPGDLECIEIYVEVTSLLCTDIWSSIPECPQTLVEVVS